ncbi:MAG: hypothetical protein QMC62_05335 [Alteromonadaceae bacterium]|jgi:hypothetical protein
MCKKIVYIILLGSMLMSCQQNSTTPVEKSSVKSEEVAKSEVAKMSIKPSLGKVDMKQLSFTARVQYMNLEGGFFGLVSKEGKHWLPMNLKKEFQQHGAIIKVTGSALNDIMTIQQWGTPFSITHIELIKAGQSGAESDVM